MHTPANILTPAASPRSTPADLRRFYARALQQWAIDALSLKRRGLDRPSVRHGTDWPVLAPGAQASQQRRAA